MVKHTTVPYFPERIHTPDHAGSSQVPCDAGHTALPVPTSSWLWGARPGTWAPTHGVSPVCVWGEDMGLGGVWTGGGRAGRCEDDWRDEQNLSGISQTVEGVLCLCVRLFPWLLDAFNFRTEIR